MSHKVNLETLNENIDFDCPFRVLPNSRIEETHEYASPTVLDGTIDSDAWAFVSGYSMQDRYSGPIMHASEYLGARMAQDVLDDVGGVYVITAAYYSSDDPEGDVIDGWALLRRSEDPL